MGEAEAEKLWLEDLSVGQEFLSRAHPLDGAQVADFARAFDPQPFHLDDVAARESLFGGLAASGWHTAALTMRLIVESVPFAGGIIGLGGEVRWPRPVRPGDVLRVRSRILEIVPSRSKPERGTVRMQSETLNQAGEVVQELTAQLMVFRRPG